MSVPQFQASNVLVGSGSRATASITASNLSSGAIAAEPLPIFVPYGQTFPRG